MRCTQSSAICFQSSSLSKLCPQASFQEFLLDCRTQLLINSNHPVIQLLNTQASAAACSLC